MNTNHHSNQKKKKNSPYERPKKKKKKKNNNNNNNNNNNKYNINDAHIPDENASNNERAFHLQVQLEGTTLRTPVFGLR